MDRTTDISSVRQELINQYSEFNFLCLYVSYFEFEISRNMATSTKTTKRKITIHIFCGIVKNLLYVAIM